MVWVIFSAWARSSHFCVSNLPIRLAQPPEYIVGRNTAMVVFE